MTITVCDGCRRTLEDSDGRYSIMIRKCSPFDTKDVKTMEDVCDECYTKMMNAILPFSLEPKTDENGCNEVEEIEQTEEKEEFIEPVADDGSFDEIIEKQKPKVVRKPRTKKQEESTEEEEDSKTPFDMGKCLALKNAGWKVKDIADEMHKIPKFISQRLYLHKQKMMKGDESNA